MIYMLGCAFFILPIAHTRIVVSRTAMSFFMWIFSHMWISSGNMNAFSCVLSIICIVSV